MARRALLASAAALVTGCGFRPLYAPGAPADILQGRIALGLPEGRFGFLLRERLETRLGPATAPEFALSVATTLESDDTAIQTDSGISRINLVARARFAVTRLDDPALLIGGQVRSFTAYNTTASPFAADVAAQEAERRVAISLADQIVLRLAASAAGWAAL